MLACIYDEDGKMKLVEKARPQAKEGTVVLKVLATSICGTDFRAYLHGSDKIIPGTTIGHELCGRIIETGDGVEDFVEGDIITVTPALGCGQCRLCRKGQTNMCNHLETIGFQYDGSFAEYMEVPAGYLQRDYVNRVPGGVGYGEAALAEPVACAINAQEYLHIEKGDIVAIFGSGFIGCIHAELAFASGAEKVIMIEPNAERRQAAQHLLPGICMLDAGECQEQRIMEYTDGRGADVAIVACSVGAAQENAQKIIAKCGRISLFGGLPGDGKGYIDSNLIHYNEVGVFGVHASNTTQNRKALCWMADHTIDVQKYITKEYPLKDILTAMEDIRTKGIMKAVIVSE